MFVFVSFRSENSILFLFFHLYCVTIIRFERFRYSTSPHFFFFKIHLFVPNISKNSKSLVEKSENNHPTLLFLNVILDVWNSP